jgi:hypothetical protein
MTKQMKGMYDECKMGYKMTNDLTWTGVGGKGGPGGMFSVGLYSDAMVVLLQMNWCSALCGV